MVIGRAHNCASVRYICIDAAEREKSAVLSILTYNLFRVMEMIAEYNVKLV